MVAKQMVCGCQTSFFTVYFTNHSRI